MSTKIYWNNICLVTKLEEQFINDKIKNIKDKIDITYFGLGREDNLLNYFSKNNHIDAQVIVSTDTDIFHDSKFDNIFSDFNPLSKFITIPLVIIYNSSYCKDLLAPESFSDLLNEKYYGKYTFGGPHNSAGKSLVKSLWFTYGQEKTQKFIDNGLITTMPAAAFQNVITGKVPIAIVPTIFALRNGISNLKMIWPKDGAIPIHSYIAKKIELDSDLDSIIDCQILGKDFQKMLVEKAAIIPHCNEVSYPCFEGVSNYPLMDPDWDFLKNLNHQVLYEMLKQKK